MLFSISFLLLALWWIAYYPALFSPDSVTAMVQITFGPWTSEFSVFYNALLWLSYHITGGVALLMFAQIVAMAAGFTYCGTALLALGARWRWVVTAVVLLSLLPIGGVLTVYEHKDVAFTIAEVYAFGACLRLVAHRINRPQTRAPLTTWVMLFVSFTLMCLFRSNAPLMVVLAAVALLVALPGQRLRTIITAAGAVLVFIIATFGLYPALGVKAPRSSLVLGPAYADIALAYQKVPKTFTQADLDLMAEETPLERWAASDNCYTSDELDVSSDWHRHAADRNKNELFKLWLRVLQRSPQIVVDARICRGSIAWNPFPSQSKPTVLLPSGANPNNLKVRKDVLPARAYRALHADPPIPGLRSKARFVERFSFAHNLEFALYRGATWCYVAFVVAFVFLRRRGADRRLWLAMTGLIMANQIVVLIDNPNQLVRYMYGPLLAGMLMLTLLSARRVADPVADEAAAPSPSS